MSQTKEHSALLVIMSFSSLTVARDNCSAGVVIKGHTLHSG